MESTAIEKIDVDQLTKNLKIDDYTAFTAYLKEIWNDLYSRVTENKNDEKDKDKEDKEKEKEKEVKVKGITKLIFDKYFALPGIIGDRFFRVLDSKENTVLSLTDFVKGMRTIFCGDYEETLKFVFDFYDLDRDGLIDKEDIRVVLSYITLAESPDVKSTGVNLSYKNRVTSQEELYKILQQCFENNNKMNFTTFKKVIENVNSDLYLMIYLFLLENKPFTKENIKPYQTSDNKDKNEKGAPKSPQGKLIASPSKNTNFSPYHAFSRKRGRRITVKSKNVDYSKMIEMTGEKKDPSKKDDIDYKRKGRKRKTVQYEANIITLGTMQDKGEQKIDQDRVKDLTRKPKTKLSSDIKEDEVQIKPAFKQKIGTKKLDSDKKINKDDEDKKNNNGEEDEFDENDFDFDDNSSDEEFKESEEEEKEEDILKCEGLLYKFVDNKMRKLYFKLVHKDLYFYKNKDDKMHKGMHNLNGLFLQEEKPKNYNGVLFYSFSVVYPSKTRVYYCNNETEYKTWISKLKLATGYTNLLDIYNVKHKLGKGKFGLVKLGENKKTHQEVAIKIMNKKNMDTSDLELVRTEIEILKICQHPNIIRLYDVFENPDYIYIIMEYCKGGDLFGYLESRGFRIPEDRVSKIMHKMCAGVYYMHSYGIAHRDLKPENVLMTSLDDDSDIRILDFGLSKIVGPYEKCDEPYGTLTYCAPEIILDEPYSKAVDLWSLGIMTYLMLSGRLPFNSQDENEIARQVAYDDPDFSRNPVWGAISAEAKDFVKRLLIKDPFKRMNIKQALEHKFINDYDSENITVKRKHSNDGSKNFEIYSSTKVHVDK